MENLRKFKLHRSHTFNYASEPQLSESTYHYDGSEGAYTITHEPKTDVLKIHTPDGRVIVDTLHSIMDREYLYEKIDSGELLQRLIALRDNLGIASIEDGIKESTFSIDDIKYRLRVDPKRKTALLNISAQVREISEELMYVEHFDLAAIQDGILNTELRTRLQKYGFKLGDTPFEIGLKISPKLF